jgi:hypothetical protein
VEAALGGGTAQGGEARGGIMARPRRGSGAAPARLLGHLGFVLMELLLTNLLILLF